MFFVLPSKSLFPGSAAHSRVEDGGEEVERAAAGRLL